MRQSWHAAATAPKSTVDGRAAGGSGRVAGKDAGHEEEMSPQTHQRSSDRARTNGHRARPNGRRGHLNGDRPRRDVCGAIWRDALTKMTQRLVRRTAAFNSMVSPAVQVIKNREACPWPAKGGVRTPGARPSHLTTDPPSRRTPTAPSPPSTLPRMSAGPGATHDCPPPPSVPSIGRPIRADPHSSATSKAAARGEESAGRATDRRLIYHSLLRGQSGRSAPVHKQ